MSRGVKEGSKRDRQYEHIKQSYHERGVSDDEAEERGADGEQDAPRARRDKAAASSPRSIASAISCSATCPRASHSD